MSEDRGVGFTLHRRMGGGRTKVKYGGSQYLTRAALRNQELSRQLKLKTKENDHKLGERLKYNFDLLLTLTKDADKFENLRKTVKYLDGELRGKKRRQWDVNVGMRECINRKAEIDSGVLSSYLPYLIEDRVVEGNLPELKPKVKPEMKFKTITPPPEAEMSMTEKAMLHSCDDMFGFGRFDLSTKERIPQVHWRPRAGGDYRDELSAELDKKESRLRKNDRDSAERRRARRTKRMTLEQTIGKFKLLTEDNHIRHRDG